MKKYFLTFSVTILSLLFLLNACTTSPYYSQDYSQEEHEQREPPEFVTCYSTYENYKEIFGEPSNIYKRIDTMLAQKSPLLIYYTFDYTGHLSEGKELSGMRPNERTIKQHLSLKAIYENYVYETTIPQKADFFIRITCYGDFAFPCNGNIFEMNMSYTYSLINPENGVILEENTLYFYTVSPASEWVKETLMEYGVDPSLKWYRSEWE